MAAKPSPADRRDQARVCFRTPVTIVTLDRHSEDIRPILIKAWTEDISLSGTQLMTKDPVEDGKVWVRFIVAGANEKLIEARIVRTIQRNHDTFVKGFERLYFYGLKFCKVIHEPGVIEWLMATIRGETPEQIPARVRRRHRAMRAGG